MKVDSRLGAYCPRNADFSYTWERCSPTLTILISPLSDIYSTVLYMHMHVHVHEQLTHDTMHGFLTGDYMGDLASSLGSQHSLFSSTYTFQDSCTYVKGVDGKVFKERMKVSHMNSTTCWQLMEHVHAVYG